jgi:hypothetical protein
VPIDVAVEEPWTGVVSEESNRDVIVRGDVTDADDVAHNGVDIIVSRVTGTPNHMERVPVQVDRVLCVGVDVRCVIPSEIWNAASKF